MIYICNSSTFIGEVGGYRNSEKSEKVAIFLMALKYFFNSGYDVLLRKFLDIILETEPIYLCFAYHIFT